MRILPLFCITFVFLSVVLVIESKSRDSAHHHHRHHHRHKGKRKLNTQTSVIHKHLQYPNRYQPHSQSHTDTRFIRNKTQIAIAARMHSKRKLRSHRVIMENTRVRRQISNVMNSSYLQLNNSYNSDSGNNSIGQSFSSSKFQSDSDSSLRPTEPSYSSYSSHASSLHSDQGNVEGSDGDTEMSDNEESPLPTEPSYSSPAPSLHNDEGSDEGHVEDTEMSEDEESELHTYRDARKNDPIHYYRMPGELCFTNEKITQEISRLNVTGNITNLQRHKIDRQRCFFYEYIFCAPVPRKNKKNGKTEIETRCVCIEGRTWSEGACFAYHNQPCRWQSDCVRSAQCLFESDLEEEKQKKEEREAAKRHKEKMAINADRTLKGLPPLYYDEEEEEEEEEYIPDEFYDYPISENTTEIQDLENTTEIQDLENTEDKDEKLQFDLGICKCIDFTKCARKIEYPNFIESISRKNYPLIILQFVGITFCIFSV